MKLQIILDLEVNAKLEFDYGNPIDTIYMFMWLEEQFPHYELSIDDDKCRWTAYNMNVQKGIRKWKEMRARRNNNEISDEDYIEWKLHFEIGNEIK